MEEGEIIAKTVTEMKSVKSELLNKQDYLFNFYIRHEMHVANIYKFKNVCITITHHLMNDLLQATKNLLLVMLFEAYNKYLFITENYFMPGPSNNTKSLILYPYSQIATCVICRYTSRKLTIITYSYKHILSQ
jgi:hypothetical protein